MQDLSSNSVDDISDQMNASKRSQAVTSTDSRGRRNSAAKRVSFDFAGNRKLVREFPSKFPSMSMARRASDSAFTVDVEHQDLDDMLSSDISNRQHQMNWGDRATSDGNLVAHF